jgi:hypothetical protein
MGYWDNEAQIWKNKYALNVYRILPFKGSPIVSVELESHDWWKVMKGIDFHIAKGYIYYVAKDQHPKGFYGDRQVIKIIRMADGSEKTLLDGVELNGDDEIWTDRYQIFNWKMVGDTIYFSGFDEANSQVVTGEIDTVAVKAGAEVNQFLSTKDVASAVGAHAVIRDMEIVKPQEPEIDTGSAPRVLNIYTDPENLYSASIEFSKYMNKEDVIEKTSVYSFDTNNSKYDVGTMKVWLGKTMHMIFDIDEDNIATDPLKNGTQYFIEIDNEARDKWNTELATFEGVGAVTTKSFTTVPDQGWYATTDERIDGITDGVVARYIDNSLVRSNDKYALIKDNIGSANMKIEFSFKMKGTNNNNRISLKLKDSKKVDWDNVNWDNDTQKIYSDNSKNQEIIRVEGHFIDKDNNEYQESWQSNTRMLTDTTNNILYTWKEGYRYDSDENRYTVHWNNQGEYVKKFDSVGDYLSTYYRVEGFYEDTNGTKYRHESGEYRNIDNFDDIIDWSDGKEYTWFDSVYVTDINDLDSVIDGFNFWDLSEMRSGFDSNVTEETERIDFTFLWNNDDTLTESSELKWVREYYENNETNVTYNEWDNNWVWDIDRTQYYTDNNTSWDWDGRVLDLTVNSWQNINYNYITGSLNNRSDSWGNVDINFDYKNIWLKGVIKIYGSNFTFSFVDDQGESFEIVNKTDIFTTTQTNSGNYRLDMQLEDSRDLVMDNFVITPLDTNGEEIGDPILNETFDGNILNSPVTLTHQYSNN